MFCFGKYDKYIKTGDATNQSLSQRIEYYKVSYYLIKRNFLFGVGSGDLLKESLMQLERMDSKLDKEFWYIVHNQFVSEFSTLGLIGFLIFVLAIFSPFVKQSLRRSYLFVVFYLIMILSFLSDNTLETQLGVSFCSFFYCLTLAHSLPVKQ
ncbi:MAG: O-antigen ligase family protein [Chloroflexia bacterium]|nr:O-antigen ligase family protein [Chloroflexia bacterium]